MKSKTSTHVSRGKTIQYLQNRILAALPPEEFQRLAPHLTETSLTFKQSLSKSDQPIPHHGHDRAHATIGKADVRDARQRLEAGSCECYGIVNGYFDEFLAASVGLKSPANAK